MANAPEMAHFATMLSAILTEDRDAPPAPTQNTVKGKKR